ncbi:MAG TPA: hypothetical protein VMW49_06845 [Candidatus Dormibacteraeota bacterium]|nr:hypothetical protein [Candidatus Dormibacteraeota bacterium]
MADDRPTRASTPDEPWPETGPERCAYRPLRDPAEQAATEAAERILQRWYRGEAPPTPPEAGA